MHDRTHSADTSPVPAQPSPQSTYRQLQEDICRDPSFDSTLEKLYSHLRAVAANIRKSSRSATIGPTELLHEASMRMMKSSSLQWNDAVHFQRIAAVAMKQILIDSARRRNAERNGGALTKITLSDWLNVTVTWDDSMLDLNRALDELGEKHSREAQAVDLHFFGGLTVSETAAALGVSDRTANADLRFARAFLFARMKALPEEQAEADTGNRVSTAETGQLRQQAPRIAKESR